MAHRKKIKFIMLSVMGFGSHIVFFVFFKPSKIFFSEMAEQIEVKLYTYDLPVHEEQKVHTYDITGHMVWQPYWIYPKTFNNTPLKISTGEGVQSLIALFLVFRMFISDDRTALVCDHLIQFGLFGVPI